MIVLDEQLLERNLLKTIFHLSIFKTKADRMGKVIWIADEKIFYYTHQNNVIQKIT